MAEASPAYATGQQNRVKKTQVSPIASVTFFYIPKKVTGGCKTTWP